MNSETVDLIATDPPFNKNRDFHATPDSLASGARFEDRWRWDEDVHEEWIDAIKDNWPGVWAVIGAARTASGDDMGAFLCWLGVRVMEMHRVLKPTGSLYLHIDHTAHAYVKAMLDGIFSRRNFRNEIVWAYRTGGASKANFARKHDTLLWYSKSESYTFHVQQEKAYTKSKSRKPGIVNYGAGEAEFFQDDVGVYNWVMLRDVWEIPYVGSTNPERTGFPTQKPLALYERIIKASSNEGDLVLDPFAGCATTPIAAELQGRRWAAIDIWEGAEEQVRKRLEANKRLLTDSATEIHYRKDAPTRTDADEIAVPDLRLRLQRAREPWERLTHAQIRIVLEKAQAVDDYVGCAGCGRKLESEFMELDHIQPKAENGADHLINRILLCGPCNGRKSNMLTMKGLRRENRAKHWMKDEGLADTLQLRALSCANWVRDHWERRAEAGL